MSKQLILPVLILIVFLLPACRGKMESKPESAEAVRLADSIEMLDSLASKLFFKNNSLALSYATKAIELSERIANNRLLARSMNVKGIVLSVDQYDSAFSYFAKALSLSERIGAENERAHIFYNLSQLYDFTNDYKNAVILLDSSIRIGLKLKTYSAVASSLVALANIYYETEDYINAERIYDSAFKLASRNKLNKEMAVSLANLSKFSEDPDTSKAMLKESLSLLGKVQGAEEEQAYIEVNLGLLQENSDSSIKYYQKAIDKAIKYNMPIVLLGAYNNIAYKYLKKKEAGKAEYTISSQAIPLAMKMKNDDWLSTLYDTYADVLVAKKEFQTAIFYLRKSIEARSVSDRLISEKQVRLLNAILELKNKNLLIMDKESMIVEKDSQLNRMYLWLAVLLILIMLAGGGILLIRQRDRMKIQLTKLEAARKIIEAEENEKERNAMELHDSSGILISKLKETMCQKVDLEPSTRRIIELHINEFRDEIRNISHRMNKQILERHPIDLLLKSFFEDTIHFNRIHLSYIIDKPKHHLNVDIAIHLFRIIQEIVTNARKHAGSSEIKMSIRFFDESAEIVYSDNGKGFNPDSEDIKGMGILNIFARVKLINGYAELDSEPGHGVYWKISVPEIYGSLKPEI